VASGGAAEAASALTDKVFVKMVKEGSPLALQAGFVCLRALATASSSGHAAPLRSRFDDAIALLGSPIIEKGVGAIKPSVNETAKAVVSILIERGE